MIHGQHSILPWWWRVFAVRSHDFEELICDSENWKGYMDRWSAIGVCLRVSATYGF